MANDKNTDRDRAVDAFLECLARCLAKRWVKRQRHQPLKRNVQSLKIVLADDQQNSRDPQIDS